MIQRKQTIFLLAVFLIGILMMYIPFIENSRSAENITYNLLCTFSNQELNGSIYGPFLLNCSVILLSFFVIFQFKKRILQYKLTYIIVVLNIIIVGMFFLLSFFNDSREIKVTFGALLPLLGAIFAFFAAYFIKKDEELVRSADRLR